MKPLRLRARRPGQPVKQTHAARSCATAGTGPAPLALALGLMLGTGGGLHGELVGLWPLDGDARDSVSGREGSFAGSAHSWLVSQNVAGLGALALNPNDERSTYVDLGDSPALRFGGHDFTVSYWVKKLVHSLNWANAYGVCKWVSGANPGVNEWTLTLLWGPNDDQPTFAIEVGTDLYSVTRPTGLSLGEWHHLVGVRRGASLELYVDGTFAAVTSIPAGASVNNAGRTLHIGASDQGPAFAASAVYDDLQIYNHALSNGGATPGQTAGAEVGRLHAHPGQTLVASLTIEMLSNTVYRLSWPDWAVGMVPTYKDDLGELNWKEKNWPGGIQHSDGHFWVTDTISGPTQFFRLRN